MRYPLAVDSWDDRERNAAKAVIDSGYCTSGPIVEQFEQEFADFFGARHAVMSNSGSSANLLAVASLMFREHAPLCPGDEVIVPAVSWGTTYSPFQQYGLKLKFVDVSADDFNIDVSQVADAVGPQTRAICAVNLLGVPCDFDALNAICREHDLILIEDNCESMGATCNGKHAGTFGDVGTYSLFFSHHICAIEGGVTVTDDAELAQIMRSLRSHGWTRTELPPHLTAGDSTDSFHDLFRFAIPGFNLRSNELSAAVAREQLQKLPDFIQARRQNYQRLQQLSSSLDGQFRLQQCTRPQDDASWFGFAFVCEPDCLLSRDEVASQLQREGIEVRPIVAGNFTRNPVMKYCDSSIHNNLAQADTLHDNGFFVGNGHVDLTDSINHLVDVLGRMQRLPLVA